jgi:hypothetical protein
LIPLLESVTIAQAALLASIGEALLTLYYGDTLLRVVNAPLSNYLPVVLGAIVPSIVWAGYFFILSRERGGLASRVSLRTATWIVLVFGLALQVAVVTIPGEMSMLSWTPLGYFHRVVSWLLRLGWVLLLVALVSAPDGPRTRRLALAMLILSAPSAIEEAYNGTWNNRGMPFWNDYPIEALWRVVMIPAIRIFYSLSQILFLWTTWGNPASRNPVGTTSLRLTP